MTVYMTKTWGFGSPSGPLQFSQRGWRDRARGMLKPGDLVVIVGTMGQETLPEEHGMILGLMEPTTTVVSSLDYDLARGPRDYDEAGNYRWPFGLELLRAWRFSEPRTALTEISRRRFNMDSAQGVVPLLADEVGAILLLPREPVSLLRPARTEARVSGLEAARRRGAPPPSTQRTGVMHMRRAPAFTYAMIVEGASTPSFKIGWAFDWKQRERHFNQAAMPDLGGVRYRTMLHELWDTAKDAFLMEQALLRTFDVLRHPHNREVVSSVAADTVQKQWIDYLIAHRARRAR
jgi:hypothetical protein